jgi:hypothetical protein
MTAEGNLDRRMTSQSGSKRRAVPPGFLHDLLQARKRMTSVGLKATGSGTANINAGGSSSRIHSNVAASTSALLQLHTLQHAPHAPVKTLPLLLEHRKKYLQSVKVNGTAAHYQQRAGEPVGLLSLPEDVLVSGPGSQRALVVGSKQPETGG